MSPLHFPEQETEAQTIENSLPRVLGQESGGPELESSVHLSHFFPPEAAPRVPEPSLGGEMGPGSHHA
jgi:hypothetical protein